MLTILAIALFLINMKAFPEQDNQEWQEGSWGVFCHPRKHSS